MSSPQVWFITGASSGFGLAMVEYVLSRGDIAVATLRKPEVLDGLKAKHPASKLLVLKLDVTKPNDIVDAFNKTKEVFGRIDVVFNNAGFSVMGEIEGTPEDVARGLFDVTFWGADRVSREAVKFFREVNKPKIGGRLLNTSSMVGLNAFAGIGYYSASKFALEGITQSLAAELDPEWNIKVTLIEPGAFITRGVTDMVKIPTHPAYTNTALSSHATRAFLDNAATAGSDPDKAVERFYKLAHLPEPPFRFLLGKDAVATARQQLKNVIADVDKYEAWSEGLEITQQA